MAALINIFVGNKSASNQIPADRNVERFIRTTEGFYFSNASTLKFIWNADSNLQHKIVAKRINKLIAFASNDNTQIPEKIRQHISQLNAYLKPEDVFKVLMMMLSLCRRNQEAGIDKSQLSSLVNEHLNELLRKHPSLLDQFKIHGPTLSIDLKDVDLHAFAKVVANEKRTSCNLGANLKGIASSTLSKIQSIKDKLPSGFQAVKQTAQDYGITLPSAIPTLGMAGGVALGLLVKMASNVATVCTEVAGKPSLYSEGTMFRQINDLKQFEITHVALAVPFILTVGNVAYKIMFREKSDHYLSVKPKDETPAQRQLRLENSYGFTTKEVGKTALLLIASIGTNLLIKPIKAFGLDPSGHIIMKAASTFGMVKAVEYVTNSGQSKLALAAATANALFDTIMLANTVGCVHSVPDVIAGAAIASGLLHATEKAVQYVGNRPAAIETVKPESPKKEKIPGLRSRTSRLTASIV